MTITTSIQKIATVAAGIALFAVLAIGTTAHAQSVSFTRDLTVGSSGPDVTALQNWLIAGGYSIPAGATGYFGAQTKAALAAYQSAKGISPAVGYFGPITRASVSGSASTGGSTSVALCPNGNTIASNCMTAPGGSTQALCPNGNTIASNCMTAPNGGSTSGLSGSGRLTNESSLGDVTTDLKEGDGLTKVVGVSFDGTDGDVQVQRVDATFIIDPNSGSSVESSNLNRYVSDVSVYLDGKKLGTMDATAGDKDGHTWTFRFSGLNGVIMKGHTGNLYVEVTPVSSVDSNEDGVTVTARLAADSVRAAGADGLSDTYVASNINSNFTVSSSNVGTLTVTAGADNPKASQVAVSSSTTTGVTLLTFNMKAKNQDVTVTDLVASFGTSDDNLNDVVSTVKLMKGSTVLKSKTLSTGTYGTVTFDNVDQTIDKDSTVGYSIVADLKGDSAYADGATLIASTTVTGWDVSDANGTGVSPSAAALGNTMTLTATGISVTKGNITTSTTVGLAGGADTTQYTIPFTVTAGDDDVFIGATVATGVTYATTSSSGVGKTDQGTANLTASDSVTGDVAGTAFKVAAGTSRTFTLNVTYTATSSGYTGVVLTSVKYGPSSSSITNSYTSNLDTFKTNDVYMTTR